MSGVREQRDGRFYTGLMGMLVADADGNQVCGFQVHLGGTLGMESGFGRKARGLETTVDELPVYIGRVVRNFVGDRKPGERFATWPCMQMRSYLYDGRPVPAPVTLDITHLRDLPAADWRSALAALSATLEKSPSRRSHPSVTSTRTARPREHAQSQDRPKWPPPGPRHA